MEVHAHTHTARKKWTHYLWEFLMLFLAVFCGFLAEYQLEHMIEHQREKEFIKSMVEDLQDDHEKLNQYALSLESGIKAMDTLINLLTDDEQLKENTSLVYYLARVAPRVSLFTSNNRTLEQLKNSGSFRLIRNNKASNKIIEYYSNFTFVDLLQNLFLREFDEYKRIASKIFNPAVFKMMEKENGEISRQANSPSLRTTNPELLNEIGVYAVYMNGSRRSIVPAVEAQQKKGAELIVYLKTEYHLK